MDQNYVQFYFRSFRKNISYYAVSLSGLTVAICVTIVAASYLNNEFSYDRFHKNSASLYRVVRGPSNEQGSALSSMALGEAIETAYPETVAVRFNNAGNARVKFRYEGNEFMEASFLFADEELFDVFSFSMKEGNGHGALHDPFTMVISEKAATIYFGDSKALGQSLQIDWGGRWYDVVITGVMENVPRQSHLKFDFILSEQTAREIFEPKSFFTDWSANFCYTYLFIPDDATKDAIVSSISSIYARNVSQKPDSLRLQPITDIHLRSHLASELSVNGNITNILLAVSVLLLTLLVAFANYVNIFLALNTRREKEVGIRKVLGADAIQLRKQFTMEALINVAIVSGLTVLTGLLTYALTPVFFTSFSEQLFDARLAGIITGILVVVFLISFYPLIALGRMDPSEALHGKGKTWVRSVFNRKVMVGMQAALIVVSLVLSFVFQKQLLFVTNSDLGYESTGILYVPQARAVRDKLELLKAEMLRYPGIYAVTFSSQIPSGNLNFKVPATIEGGNPDGSSDPWPVSLVSVEFDFARTFSISMQSGRFFSREYKTDSLDNFVINASFARAAGWAEPIGKRIEITYNAGNGTTETRKGHVIGVTEDFHFESMYKSIEPLAMIIKPFWYYYVSVQLAPVSDASIAQVKAIWNAVAPDVPFEYSFITDRLQRTYESDRRWLDIAYMLAFIVITLGAMGAFSLITFIIHSRRKQNSIRKILGATTSGLAFSMYLEMGQLLIISGLISLPIGWLIAQQWLQLFAYRVEVDLWLLLSAILALLIVFFAVITTQVVAASRINPVDHLKTE